MRLVTVPRMRSILRQARTSRIWTTFSRSGLNENTSDILMSGVLLYAVEGADTVSRMHAFQRSQNSVLTNQLALQLDDIASIVGGRVCKRVSLRRSYLNKDCEALKTRDKSSDLRSRISAQVSEKLCCRSVNCKCRCARVRMRKNTTSSLGNKTKHGIFVWIFEMLI